MTRKQGCLSPRLPGMLNKEKIPINIIPYHIANYALGCLLINNCLPAQACKQLHAHLHMCHPGGAEVPAATSGDFAEGA